MRGLFGLVGLLLVVAIVGVLVRKQLAPGGGPAASIVPAIPGQPAPTGTVADQSRQVQDQMKKAVEGAMQQPRPMPDGQ